MPRTHFIINPASGAGAGARLAQEVATRLGPERVSLLGRCDLATVVSGLEQPDIVVACGGDGTASAVAEVLASRPQTAPAMAILPLGTGNDLARVLGWSRAGDDLAAFLRRLPVSARRQLDRWRVTGPQLDRGWCNYLSLGVDARVAQHFHDLRGRHPWLVRGGTINRGVYALLGAQQRGIELRHRVRLAGGPVLPAWAAVLVLGNIPSYAGGVALARGMRFDDGRMELVALGQGLRLGLVTARLRRPRLLGRPDRLEFDLAHTLAMQVDGEPFSAGPGHYRVMRDTGITVVVADVAHGA